MGWGDRCRRADVRGPRHATIARFGADFLQPHCAPVVVQGVVGLHTDALVPLFAGFLFALALSHPPREIALAVNALQPREPLCELDPDALCARDLRRLPRIGPARALAIVRARFERGLTGGPEAWSTIPGIGPETVRVVRDELRLDGAPRLPRPPTGAYTPPGSRP